VSADSAPGRLRRLRLVLPVVISTVLLDQLSKLLAAQTLSPLVSSVWLGGLVSFVYAENPGAVSSIGADLAENLRFGLFTLLPLLVCLGLLALMFIQRRISPVALLACSLMVGGGLGNLLDRFIHDGAVIDFISLNIGWLSYQIFNLADLAITLGIAMYIAQLFSRRSRPAG